jgi:hypothetical protein
VAVRAADRLSTEAAHCESQAQLVVPLIRMLHAETGQSEILDGESQRREDLSLLLQRHRAQVFELQLVRARRRVRGMERAHGVIITLPHERHLAGQGAAKERDCFSCRTGSVAEKISSFAYLDYYTALATVRGAEARKGQAVAFEVQSYAKRRILDELP